jgi:glycosyltransferase involved in cell wall biosynthesis
MKVVHLCHEFSALTETFIYDYLTELNRQGFEGHVVTYQVSNLDSRPFPNVHHVPRPGRWDAWRLAYRVLAKAGIGSRPDTSWDASWAAYRHRVAPLIRRLAPDVLHAHFGTNGAWAWPLAQQLGVPIVVSFHGLDAFSACDSDVYGEAYKHLFEHADGITCVSELMWKHLVELGSDPQRTHVIHVGKRVDEYPFYPPAEETVKAWISVGRLTEKKGHLDTLRAFRQIIDQFPDQRLTIIGDGPLRQAVEAFVQDQGLTDHVRLLGNIAHSEVKRRLQAADAFILSSRTAANGDREGVPTVLMEAQFLGLPCVSTRHSGIPEVIPKENQWLLADEGEPDEVASRMRALITADHSTRCRLARAGREKVESEFDLSREARKLAELYKAVCVRD